MDRSNSNSEPSNLFVISSESSRSNRKSNRNDNYVRFVRRVKELLDVPGSDLDQLYQQLEDIVLKYFQEHRVVDFQEMYAHIVALKSNSSKMNDIVSLLEKRLVRSSNKHEEGRKSSKTEEFETTINSHKHTRNSLHREEAPNTREDAFNIFADSYAQVNTSVKYNHVLKPAAKETHELTPKANRSKTQNESSSKNSPSKHSPAKTNLSEEYYSRNRQYEAKIQEMLKELQTIKHSITTTKSPHHPSFKLDLKENSERSSKKEPASSLTQIKPSTDTNEKASKVSQNTIVIENEQQSSNNNITSSEIQQEQHTATQKSSYERIEIQSLQKYADNVARQIEELKQVASKHQIESAGSHSELKAGGSEASILPPDKINHLIKKVSEQKSKRQPILQQIENTTSQNRISENMIPSFKIVPQKEGTDIKQRQIFTTELNLTSSKNPVNVSYNQNIRTPPNMLQSSQVVKSFQSNVDQPQYNMSTIKYVYNPYPTSAIYPNHSLYVQPEPPRFSQFQQAPSPIIQRQAYQSKEKTMSSQAGNRAYLAQQGSSPIVSSNSSTSIMHPHLFARERQNISLINQLDQRSYVSPLQKQSNNTIYSQPSSNKSLANNSSQPSLSNQSSTGSFNRKGLNVVTHVQRRS